MKTSYLKIALLLFLASDIFISCKKDSFITSGNALVSISADTLHFDTVFTSVGSVTQSFKIFNLNDQKLRLSKIELAGGTASSFKINVNGAAGTSFSDIDIASNDSIYVFVSVTIDPNQFSLPFLIQDSILISFNGNNDFVHLDAYGRNAHFLKNRVVTQDSTFTNELPFVILGSLTIRQGATLTINKGAEIFCHQDAALIVNGTLKVNGERTPDSRVIFAGDRLDDPYTFYPGSWRGIIFSQTSTGNQINAAIIKNAIQGISIDGNGNLQPQLNLYASIITNNLNEGIKATNSNIYAENCLITNCGLNNIAVNGGSYHFVYCTVASYSNILLNHGAPVLFLSDTISNAQSVALSANFTNDIFFGETGLFNDEIQLFQNGSDFNAQFDHVLYKAQGLPESMFQNSINGADPGFVNIDLERAVFDFHLLPGSPCVDAGKPISVNTDLEGNPRNGTSPDLGCYELQ